MSSWEAAVDEVAAHSDFAGVVSVDRAGEVEFAKAYGLADRARRIPNTVDTRFGTASGGKPLTALAVVSLIEQGVLSPSTTARSVLGADLPLIDDRVTVEHLLAHRSGIGDYLDEDEDDGYDTDDYVLPVPVHQLVTTEQFLAVLDGFPTKFAPGERFAYCNGGYMVLALIAERASGVPYHDLVHERVCAPAGMVDTGFFRSDELPDRVALGYLSIDGVFRTNLFHLPMRANGDGGVHTTAADVSALWRSLFAGRIVSAEWVAEMVRPRSELPDGPMRHGLSFWLHRSNDAVRIQGGDAGESFYSLHDPNTSTTYTVLSNSSEGAWPLVQLVLDRTGLGGD